MYAAQHPTRGVIAVEGAMRVGAFAGMVQSLEPVLRGPGFDDAWGRISANVFRLDKVAPDVRDFVLTTTKARQEIVLGYWQDLFEMTPSQLDALVIGGAAALRKSGVPYLMIVGEELSREDATFMQEILPDALKEVWPNSGHFPHLAHPKRFAKVLAETGKSGNRAW